MELTETLVPDYLRSRELLVGRGVRRVQGAIRRSFCATVELDDGTRWFVKQARRTAGNLPLADLANEAAVLQWAWRSAAGLSVRPLIPEMVLFDEGGQVLVTEYLGAYRPLLDHYQRRAVFGRSVARAVARGLARCHAVRPVDDEACDENDGLRCMKQAPFANWEHPTPEQIASQPEGFVEFVELVQNTEGLTDALRALRSTWRPRCLIHADAKSDNLLFRSRSASGSADLRLIDWELAGWGDPAWDVGSIIGDYLYHWLGSVVPTASGTLDDWLAQARVPFDRVHHALREFWAAYVRHGILDGDGVDAARVTSYAGVFLLERTLATALVYGVLSSTALCLLQVAKQLIREPESATRRLLW